jgi:hypothetical protein
VILIETAVKVVNMKLMNRFEKVTAPRADIVGWPGVALYASLA